MATVSENKKIKTVQFTVAYFLFSLLWMGGLAVVIAVLLPQHLREVVGVKEFYSYFWHF